MYSILDRQVIPRRNALALSYLLFVLISVFSGTIPIACMTKEDIKTVSIVRYKRPKGYIAYMYFGDRQ